MLAELQKQVAYENPPPETDDGGKGLSPSMGILMEVAIAAAGQTVIRLGGRTACETDVLAAANAEFPKAVPIEELEAFNKATLKPVMEEADEMRRYAAIADFFKRSA